MGWAVIISRRPAPLALLLIPWAHQAQSNPNAPSDLAAAIVGGSIALEWEAPTQHAASISGAARVDETLTTRIPEFAGTHALRHAAFSRLCVPDDGAVDAGIPDATGTTCSRSDEDDGASINARVPFPDHRDRQETPAGDPVAYPMRPRQAPHDPQVEAGDPALGVTPAAARSWRPDAGPAIPSGIAPSPIQEGEGKLPGNARRLPLFRRTALM